MLWCKRLVRDANVQLVTIVSWFVVFVCFAMFAYAHFALNLDGQALSGSCEFSMSWSSMEVRQSGLERTFCWDNYLQCAVCVCFVRKPFGHSRKGNLWWSWTVMTVRTWKQKNGFAVLIHCRIVAKHISTNFLSLNDYMHLQDECDLILPAESVTVMALGYSTLPSCTSGMCLSPVFILIF